MLLRFRLAAGKRDSAVGPAGRGQQPGPAAVDGCADLITERGTPEAFRPGTVPDPDDEHAVSHHETGCYGGGCLPGGDFDDFSPRCGTALEPNSAEFQGYAVFR